MITRKPYVTKKFKTSVFPEMKNDGFVQLSTSLYGRIVDDEILQWISLQVQTRLRREYKIEYGIMLLSSPNEFFTKTLGGDFTKGTSNGYYGAQTKKMLEESIEKALTAYKEEISPVLELSKTIPLFIQRQKELKEKKYYLYSNGHTELIIACAYCLMEKHEEAIHYAKSAASNFKRLYEEQPMRNWAIEGELKAQNLLKSIEENKEKELLNNWREETIQNLKLKKLAS